MDRGILPAIDVLTDNAFVAVSLLMLILCLFFDVDTKLTASATKLWQVCIWFECCWFDIDNHILEAQQVSTRNCRYSISLDSDSSLLSHWSVSGLFRFMLELCCFNNCIFSTSVSWTLMFPFDQISSKSTCISEALAKLQRWSVRLLQRPWWHYKMPQPWTDDISCG